MDLLAIKNKIIGRGIASSLETYIYQWINEAYQEIWNAYDWNFKKSVGTLAYTTSTATYPISDISSTCGKIIFIDETSVGKRLERLSLINVADTDPTFAATSSIPLAYTEVGTSIILYPTYTSSGDLTVVYNVDITELTNATDVPLLPTRWHQAIVELAYAKALMYDDDNRFTNQYTVAMKWIKDMKREQNLNFDEISRMKLQMPDSGIIR